MRVSIIIRCKNEAKTLRKVLHLYKKQTIQPFEIIIIDDNSTDKTKDIADKFHCKLITVDKHPYNHAYACNLGVKHAKGDIILLTNAHTFPISNRWLEKGISYFRDTKVAGCCGDIFPDPERSSIWEEYRGKLLFSVQKSKLRVYTKVTLGGFSMFYTYAGLIRRDLWNEYQFNEEYSAKHEMGEDVEWAIHFIKKGYEFVVDPELSVYHSHGENLVKILKSQYKYGKHYLEAYIASIAKK